MKRRYNIIAASVLFLYLCAILFPSFPAAIGVGLDPSWELGLNLAHRQGLSFGKDIAFTYGPLAYLSYPDPAAVTAWSVIAWKFTIYFVLVGALGFLLWRQGGSSSTLFVFISLIALWCMRFSFGASEELDLAYLAVCLAILISISPRAVFWFFAAGALAGTLILVKVSDGIVAFTVFYLLLGRSVLAKRVQGRMLLGVALTPPIVLTIAYVLSGNRASEIFLFFRNSLSIASGYSEAMAIVGPQWQVVLGLMVLVAMVLCTIAANRSHEPFIRTALVVLFGWAALKHCLVRQDGHAVPLHTELAVACSFGLIAAPRGYWRRALGGLVLLNIVLALIICRVQAKMEFDRMGDVAFGRVFQTSARQYADATGSWTRLIQANDAAFQSRQFRPEVIRLLKGHTMEDLTWNVDVVRANHLRWNPRPVFQSYAAYTTHLNSINSQHLRDDGAEFLSLKLEDIDQRHPFLDDTLDWPQILDNYDLVQSDRGFLILQRRATHRLGAFSAMNGPQHAALGGTILLPAVDRHDLLMMQANIPLSGFGLFNRALVRADPMYLEATYRSGTKARYRVNRSNIGQGAIINFLPRTQVDLFPLFGFDRVDSDGVTSIKFSSDSPAQVSHDILLTWLRAPLREETEHPLPLDHPETSSFTSIWRPEQPIANAYSLRAIPTQGTTLLLPSGPDPQILINTSRDLTQFHTLLLRAKFSVSDQINVFFGRQSEGRGYGGYVNLTNQWVDVFVNLDTNPFWRTEAGSSIRFDPVTDMYPNSKIELKGIWGSAQRVDAGNGEMALFLSEAAKQPLP